MRPEDMIHIYCLAIDAWGFWDEAQYNLIDGFNTKQEAINGFLEYVRYLDYGPFE